MLSQNLSHRELKSRLEVLVPSKLVSFEQKGKKRVIRTTKLGVAAWKCYRNAIALLNGQVAPYPHLDKTDSETENERDHQRTLRDRKLTQIAIAEH